MADKGSFQASPEERLMGELYAMMLQVVIIQGRTKPLQAPFHLTVVNKALKELVQVVIQEVKEDMFLNPELLQYADDLAVEL